jgi:hypothetical protein
MTLKQILCGLNYIQVQNSGFKSGQEVALLKLFFSVKASCGVVGRSQRFGKRAVSIFMEVDAKCWLQPISPHGALTEKNRITIVTAFRTLNPTRNSTVYLLSGVARNKASDQKKKYVENVELLNLQGVILRNSKVHRNCMSRSVVTVKYRISDKLSPCHMRTKAAVQLCTNVFKLLTFVTPWSFAFAILHAFMLH